MPKLLFGVLGLCLLVVSKVFGSEVAIGVFAYQGERAAADWSPVIRYLNQALPEHHFRLDQYDAAGLRQAIAGHQVDLVITNPGYYVSMEAAFGISRIATLDTKDDHPARALSSVVLARPTCTHWPISQGNGWRRLRRKRLAVFWWPPGKCWIRALILILI